VIVHIQLAKPAIDLALRASDESFQAAALISDTNSKLVPGFGFIRGEYILVADCDNY
jgi:hypothetical protein